MRTLRYKRKQKAFPKYNFRLLENRALKGSLGESGLVHFAYYGDMPCGTHKGELARKVLAEADKRGTKAIALISSGSASTAYNVERSLNYPETILFEILPTESNLVNGKRWAVEDVKADLPEAKPIKRIRVKLDLSKNYREESLEKEIREFAEANPSFKQKLREMGLVRRTPLNWRGKLEEIVDVTNHQEFLGKEEPIYKIDPNLLSQYNYIIAPLGTGELVYSILKSLGKIKKENVPSLIAVTVDGHPFTIPTRKNPNIRQSSARKLITPYLNTASDLAAELLNKRRKEKSENRENDIIYAPTEDKVNEARGRFENLTESPYNQDHFYDFHTREKIKIRVCGTGCSAASFLFEEAKEKQGERLIYLPRVSLEPFTKPNDGYGIEPNAKFLCFITGKSRDEIIKRV